MMFRSVSRGRVLGLSLLLLLATIGTTCWTTSALACDPTKYLDPYIR